ncbi:hypothetical protein SAMN05428970_1767 [Agromyces sp. CF514]|uniref:three-helix bundle dimerization domain-containing protein n=1 Tax=Agromyces sp. CF514 TaxID=1881031 RepID=UPI0008EF9A27|nr:hypothetical protein [Agromyces sp. CF514]SFR74670.1 hypothetical protein SAMN05428970_1767 [Agromyces sp. CF514]
MSDPVERNAVANVLSRLRDRFPSVEAERVGAIVAEETARLASNPIREYVPSLIEHAADERLRQEADPVDVGGGDPGGPVLVSDDEIDPMEVERNRRLQHDGFLFGDPGGGPV